jgi:hypothetical protein
MHLVSDNSHSRYAVEADSVVHVIACGKRGSMPLPLTVCLTVPAEIVMAAVRQLIAPCRLCAAGRYSAVIAQCSSREVTYIWV